MKFTPQEMGKLSPNLIILVVVGILVIILLATSVFIVDQTSKAVITRFGKFLNVRDPGLHFKLPFGIDRSYIVNVQNVITQEFGYRTLRGGINPTYSSRPDESVMLTGDLNIVDVEWIIQYRISDPTAWVFNVYDRTETIRDVSRSVINMLVGDRAIMDVMGVERSAIEVAGQVLMNETYSSYNLGIYVIAVKLQNVTPPKGVQEAFEDVNKAMQDLERLINEGQELYNERIPRAKGEAERVIRQAHGYRAERVNRANGDVARFVSVYEEFIRSQDVTRQRLYYEMMEEIFKNEEGITIIDRNLTNFIPLMNLGGR